MNLITLEHRPAPLSLTDFDKLETAIKKSFEILPVMAERRIPIEDAQGNVYRWEWGRAEVGVEVKPRGEPDPRLLEAVQRPASPAYVTAHLTRLSAHKRNTKGSGFQIILEDIARDLGGVSEWAVVKSCAVFRREENPFFPDTSRILVEVKKWDKLARSMGERPEPVKALEDPACAPESKISRRRKEKFLGMLLRQNRRPWEQRFFEMIGERSKSGVPFDAKTEWSR